MLLDNDQKKAAEYLDNALVIAGAGSGKTTTIIAKINYLIEKSYYQEKDILVISFTNETVESLKKRVKYNVDIKTFHKLALDIINDNHLHICQDNYLDYIINEYLKINTKNKILKLILQETTIYELKILIKTFINLYKSNYDNTDYLIYLYKHSWFKNKNYLKLIIEIYCLYLKELKATNTIDFNDMISYATQLINANERTTPYKFIIIDEFQDTSHARFNLIHSIIKQNNSKLFVVGDDYQSIYRFSGCDLDIFLNINKYIPNIKRLFINHNYRNNQTLINIANDFILKNQKQIKKNTICHKNVEKPIVIHFYKDKSIILNKVISNIQGKTLILGRNNRDQKQFNILENDQIKFLTIHRSKGLEEDNIILVNLENHTLGFPSQIKNEKLISKVLKRDYIIYEEERRLMYVALTRTKNKIYLLVPYANYSIFIKELIKNYKTQIEFHYH